MDLNKNTSLARRAAIATIASAWYHERALELIRRHSTDPHFHQMWKETEDKVFENLFALPVPISVKQYFVDFCQPMGKEIRNWMDSHKFTHNFMGLSEEATSKVLCWNLQGDIDMKQTAEKILANTKVDRYYFRLACMHSFEDEIMKVWPQIRGFFDSSVPQVLCNMDPQVMFWICHLEHSIDWLMEAVDYIGYKDNFHFAFWLSVSSNNEGAAKFFLTKLPKEERQEVVYKTMKHLCESNCSFNYPMLPFLLCYLGYPAQEDFLCNHPLPILLQFLRWPRQCCFMDIANRMWHHLSANDFYCTLEDIAHCVSEFHRSEVYINIFKKFWQNGPIHCRDYIQHKCIQGTFLIRLSLLRYTDAIIGIIIQSFTPDQKQQMIFSYNGIQLLGSLMKKQRWETIQLIFEECIPLDERAGWIDNLTETYRDAFEHNSTFASMTGTERDHFFEMLKKLRETH